MTERERLITEMAWIMCEKCAVYTRGCEHPPCDAIVESAEVLYNAGYRRQIEGENVTGTPSLFECSVCHWYDWDTTTGDTSDYNYCPNCGARMKGGAEIIDNIHDNPELLEDQP